MKDRRKKGKPVRTRDWRDKHDDAFSHDRPRHLKAEGMAPAKPMPPAEDVIPNAIVLSHTGRWAFVQQDGEELLCLIDEGLGDAQSSVLTPGDQVRVEFQENQPVVRGVAPRRTKLSRITSVHSRVSEQVIAANVDLLVIVASTAKPAFKAGLIDRYLVTAELGSVTPVLVVNKIDLAAEPPVVQEYREIGLTVLNTSCVGGTGIEALRETLRGKLSVIAGASGVGKSSLLNAMDPRLTIVTEEVSASTEKGRHTTTAARLYTLEGDVRVIDTPGIRALALGGLSVQELTVCFPELVALADQCRFRDCTHTHEPDCAVRNAAGSESLSRHRYASYLRIRASLSP